MLLNCGGACEADTMGIEYLDGLYGYAMALTRNHAQAEDLVQETYVRAIPAMGRLQKHSNMNGRLFHNYEKCLAQPVEKVAQWPSNVSDRSW